MELTKAQDQVTKLMKILKENHNALDHLENELQTQKATLAAEFTGKKKKPEEAIKKASVELEELCDRNRDALFADGTIVTLYGAVGYRKLTMSLTIEDESKTIAWIKKSKKALIQKFLKIKESVDVMAIKKALKEDAIKAAELEKGGIEVVDDAEKWAYAIDKKTI